MSSRRITSTSASLLVLLLGACSSGSSEGGSSGPTPIDRAAAGIPEPRAEGSFRSTPDLARAHPFGVQDMVRMERVGAPVPFRVVVAPVGSHWVVVGALQDGPGTGT